MKLELRGITKAFGPLVANDHIDLTVEPGQIHALLGENGAGKSTLMNVLYGLHQPDAGEILIDDEPVTFSGPGDAVAAGIGMVHQHFMLVPVFTVAESVALGYEPVGSLGLINTGAAAAKVTEISRRFGFDVDPHALIEDLPVGVQQRVEIIKALARDAKVLILDEPTAALDVEATAQVSSVLRQRLTGAGITTLLVSHDIAEVLALASHMIVMGEGRVVEEGEPARVLASPSSVFAARLAGLNIVAGPIVTRPGMVGVSVGEGELWAADLSGFDSADAGRVDAVAGDAADDVASGGSGQGGRVALTFPPEAVALSREESHASPRSVLPGVVAGIDVNGSLVSVRVALAGGVSVTARVTASAWADLGLGVGDSLWASVKATQVRAIRIAARE